MNTLDKQLQFMIECISRMDTDMLNIMLDDNCLLRGYSKEAFFIRLENVLNQFKAAGDTNLFTVKGSCKNGDCIHRGCSGYAFVGNKSGLHLDFVFIDNENSIEELCWCHNFRAFDNSISQSENKIEFNPTENVTDDEFKSYMMFFVHIHEAMTNLYQDRKPVILETETIHEWLDQYSALYDNIFPYKHHNSDLSKFTSLYNELDRLRTFSQHNQIAREANIEFELIKNDDDKKLALWLYKHEQIGLYAIDSLACIFENLLDFNTKYINIYSEKYILIHFNDFKEIAKFKNYFHIHYYTKFNHYCTISKDACLEIMKLNGDKSPELLLGYHLKVLGMV